MESLMLINRNKLLNFFSEETTKDENAIYGFGLTVGGESKSTL